MCRTGIEVGMLRSVSEVSQRWVRGKDVGVGFLEYDRDGD